MQRLDRRVPGFVITHLAAEMLRRTIESTVPMTGGNYLLRSEVTGGDHSCHSIEFEDHYAIVPAYHDFGQ